MRPNRDTPISQALARLASRRHGIVTLEQLRALGYSDSAVARLVRAGRLHRLYPGVFAVGHTALTTEGRLLAAVLACGPGAALSHASAAWLWDLRRDANARIHVTVPTTNGRRPPSGIVLHRTRRPIELTRREGITVTTPMRTLADLADTLPERQLEKALEQAHSLRLLDVTAVDALHSPGRRGPSRLQRLVRAHDVEHTRTRSELEDALLALCDRYGIPRPCTNVHIEGYEADFAWPDHKLIVEVDSWRHHSSRASFEHDRRRDAHHTARGWRVVRLTHARITGEPAEVAALLARLTRGSGSVRRARRRLSSSPPLSRSHLPDTVVRIGEPGSPNWNIEESDGGHRADRDGRAAGAGQAPPVDALHAHGRVRPA